MSSQVIKHEVDAKSFLSSFNAVKSYFLSKWLIVATAGIIGTLLGVAFAFIIKPQYEATTTFVLENAGKPKLGGYSDIVAQFGLGGGGGSGGLFSDEDNMMVFLKSRTIISQTLRSPLSNQQLLIDRYLDFSGLRKKWQNNLALNDLRFHTNVESSTRLEDSVISYCYKKILEKNLLIQKIDKELNIVSVTTIAPDEAFAKSFTDNVIANVTQLYIDLQTKKSRENLYILKNQVDSVRGVLNAALSGAAAASDANPNLNPAFQRTRFPAQKKMIDAELNKAILVELVKNLEVAEITVRRETPLVQVIDQPVLPLQQNHPGLMKCIVIGCILCSALTLFYLGIKFYFRSLMEE